MFQDWQVSFPLSSLPVNQLGKVNELIIKPDLSESTEGQEDKDVVEEAVDGESGSKADSVFTATSFESALNLVITKTTSYKWPLSYGACWFLAEIPLCMVETYHFACVVRPCVHGTDNRLHAQGFNHVKYRLNWSKMNCFQIRTDFLQFPLLLILICTCNKLLRACICAPKFFFFGATPLSNICFSSHNIMTELFLFLS